MKTLAALLFATALPLSAQTHSPNVPTTRVEKTQYLIGTVKGDRFWTETEVTGELHGRSYDGDGYTDGKTESRTKFHYIFALETLGGIRVFEATNYLATLDAVLDKGDKVVIKLRSDMKQSDGKYTITPSDIVTVNGKKIDLKEY